MDEKSIDSLELKKKILFPHLDFVKEMLVKVKGNSIEEKWKIMYECITSDKKRPSYEKIKQMEKTLIALKSQSKHKSNAQQDSPTPSTSKVISEKIYSKEAKTVENTMERDPRKRNFVDQSSTAIYNAKQRAENKSLSRSPVRNASPSTRFQPNDESERRWNERPSNFPRNNEKFSRNFQESFRGRGRGRYPRGRPFNKHSFDNDSRFRSNQRNTSISFNDRPQFRDERNQSLGRDDPNFKRKRSQSPVNHTSRQMPKRRSSCYQPNKNTNEIDFEKIKRQNSTDSSKSSTDNKASNLKIDEIAKPTSSRIETKVVRRNDNSPSCSKVDNSQSASVKNETDKKEAVPINLAEAIKKIQMVKIPKLGLNKNESKPEVPAKQKDVDKNKNSNKRISPTPRIVNKQQDIILKDGENKSKVAIIKEKEIDTDKLQSALPENKTEPTKSTKATEHETTICKLKESSDDIVNEPNTSSNSEIEEVIKSQEIDETKPDETVGKNVNHIEPMETTTISVESEINKPEPISLNPKHSEFKNLDKTESTLTEPANEELIISNPVENDTNELVSKNQDDNKNDQIDKSKSSTSVDANEIDEGKNTNNQDQPTSSVASKAVPVPKVSVLTNLLENEEEDPEKVLEGLISVLGAEKMKKMQDLLLKNTIKSENISESKLDENLSSNAETAEAKDNDEKTIISIENKTENNLDASIKVAVEDESKNEKNVEEAKEIESVQTNSPTLKALPSTSTSPVKNKISPSSSPEKKKRKPRKKHMTELDKLHENILSSIDCEGIMRACGQARVSVKPKNFEASSSTSKNQETKPFTLKLLRLSLRTDDMPVLLNDEFYQKYMTIQETKSRTNPKPQKRRTVSQEKPIIKVAKLESEFKTEPSNPVLVKEVSIVEVQKPILPINEIEIERNIETESKPIVNLKKKKKRKLLSWSKGILKKKPKRFKLSSLYEWEDVDSSDDNIIYDRTMKLKTFKNLLGTFAKKCGYKKVLKKINVLSTSATGDQKADSSIQSDSIADEKSSVKENDLTFVVPKRINLPLEKNLLTMITKNSNSEMKSPTSISESPNLKATIKLPTVETSVQSSLPSIQQTQQTDTLAAGPSNEMNTKIYSSQNNPQKVVIVKPLAKETNIETVKVRSLSAQEQQALKEALSTPKVQQPASSIAQQNNEIIKNMLTNLNSSLNITKISSPKSANASTSKDEPIKKSLPMISSVESISPKISTVQKNSSKEQKMIPKIVSIKSTGSSAATSNDKFPKMQEIVTASSKEPGVLPTRPNEPTPSIPDPIEAVNATNESIEIVDLIDDDDDDEIVDIMRPWIEKSDFKSRKDQFEAIKMINNAYCLASLYKCMGSSCSFFTNDRNIFQKHLELHREHQNTDSQNYLLCCYCSFRPKTINVLLVHIDNAHSYGKFGCRYCFYRSINEYQVTANHHSNFHRLKEKCVIVFEPRKIKNENIEKSMISESIPKVCHPLPCPYCRIGIYTIPEFESHVASHKENFTTVCIKCNLTTNKLSISQHLLKCFNKFGNYQCVFCVFGTSIFSAIDSHLATEHPDKLSYFAERSLNAGKNPTSIESLTTKELSKRITGNVKKMHLTQSFNDKTYKNSRSVGRLADNLIVDPTARPSSDSSCFIQIGEVMSLHD